MLFILSTILSIYSLIDLSVIFSPCANFNREFCRCPFRNSIT
nr:MAG TPA: hypothetical protein [Bacteriophage sp.]